MSTSSRIKYITKTLGLKTPIILPPFSREVSFALSFFGKLPLISIASGSLKDREIIDHEIGHLFFGAYYKKIIDKNRFISLFGNPSKWYYGLWYFTLNTRFAKESELKKGFITDYASVHPHEDFAETFAAAMNDIRFGSVTHYEDRLVDQKVAFVRHCIRKAMRAAK